jgi:hypothetical protein
MSLILRYPISLVLVLAALAGTAAVFTVARPQFRSADGSEMVDFSKRTYRSLETVQSAFAAEGIQVRVVGRFNGFITLSNGSAPVQADALQVVVAPKSGNGSWGPRLEPYDERFDNLLVTYGGKDERLLARVKSAVSALR